MGHLFGSKKIIFLLWVNVCVIHAIAQTTTYTEEQKISHLIAYIGSLSNTVFIRNGTEHSAKDAAAHLQMKRERAGKRLKTSEDFINKIASSSSMTGKPYQIKFSNGKTVECEIVLRLELKKLMEGRTELLHP